MYYPLDKNNSQSNVISNILRYIYKEIVHIRMYEIIIDELLWI